MNTPTLPVSPVCPGSALKSQDLGHIDIPSGFLLVGDPFRGLIRLGSPQVEVPAGRYRVVRTLQESDNGWEPIFLSLVISEPLLEARQQWQKHRLDRDGDDNLPPHAMEEAGDLDDDEEREAFWADCASGCIGMVDADLFAQGMPADSEQVGDSWYDRLFEHGKPGSWFDQMDSTEHGGAGVAMIHLPHGDGEIAISQASLGPRRVFRELAFIQPVGPEEDGDFDEVLDELLRHGPALVALHVELQ